MNSQWVNRKTDLDNSLTAHYKTETESRRNIAEKLKHRDQTWKLRILFSGSYKNEKTGKKGVTQTKVVKQMLKKNAPKIQKKAWQKESLHCRAQLKYE